jgi:hypothetical protein
VLGVSVLAVAIPTCAGWFQDDTAPHQATNQNAAQSLRSPEGMAISELNGGPVCETQGSLEQLTRAKLNRNQERWLGLFATGECTLPPKHTRVTIVDNAMLKGLAKVSPYGNSEVSDGWTEVENVCVGQVCR